VPITYKLRYGDGDGDERQKALKRRCEEREFFIDNLLVRIHLIIEMD